MDKKIDIGIEMSDEELMEMLGGAVDIDTTQVITPRKRREPPISPMYGIVAKYGVQPLYGIKPIDKIQPLYGIIPSK